MKYAKSAILAIITAGLAITMCSCESPQKNSYRTYPQNRPADWEKNSMAPAMSF